MISFTIDNNKSVADSGMTGEEGLNSEYYEDFRPNLVSSIIILNNELVMGTSKEGYGIFYNNIRQTPADLILARDYIMMLVGGDE